MHNNLGGVGCGGENCSITPSQLPECADKMLDDPCSTKMGACRGCPDK